MTVYSAGSMTRGTDTVTLIKQRSSNICICVLDGCQTTNITFCDCSSNLKQSWLTQLVHVYDLQPQLYYIVVGMVHWRKWAMLCIHRSGKKALLLQPWRIRRPARMSHEVTEIITSKSMHQFLPRKETCNLWPYPVLWPSHTWLV